MPYLNAATLGRYVADSTAVVLQVHARLRSALSVDGLHTALAWLDEEQL